MTRADVAWQLRRWRQTGDAPRLRLYWRLRKTLGWRSTDACVEAGRHL